jgi:D-alanyl-D-alanine carboxypeptidase
VRVAVGTDLAATQRPMLAGDRFRVGSITKTFVATLVLQLAAEHRLSLDDTVERWLPGLVPGGEAISVRQLLRHQSGLFDYAADPATFRPIVAALAGLVTAMPLWIPTGVVIGAAAFLVGSRNDVGVQVQEVVGIPGAL